MPVCSEGVWFTVCGPCGLGASSSSSTCTVIVCEYPSDFALKLTSFLQATDYGNKTLVIISPIPEIFALS